MLSQRIRSPCVTHQRANARLEKAAWCPQPRPAQILPRRWWGSGKSASRLICPCPALPSPCAALATRGSQPPSGSSSRRSISRCHHARDCSPIHGTNAVPRSQEWPAARHDTARCGGAVGRTCTPGAPRPEAAPGAGVVPDVVPRPLLIGGPLRVPHIPAEQRWLTRNQG
jgi:hypothetical protein